MIAVTVMEHNDVRECSTIKPLSVTSMYKNKNCKELGGGKTRILFSSAKYCRKFPNSTKVLVLVSSFTWSRRVVCGVVKVEMQAELQKMNGVIKYMGRIS